MKSMESARAEDPERIELSDMLESWGAAVGIGPGSRMKLAVVLLKGLDMTRDHSGAELTPAYPDFHAALQTMAQRSAGRSGRSGPPDARMFGKWLQRFKGRIVDGKRFMSLSDGKHGLRNGGLNSCESGKEGKAWMVFEPSRLIWQSCVTYITLTFPREG